MAAPVETPPICCVGVGEAVGVCAKALRDAQANMKAVNKKIARERKKLLVNFNCQ
jgi:hypothetical protein